MAPRALPLFAAVVLFSSLTQAAARASEPVTAERTLAVSGPVTLDVKSDPGGVIVTAGPAGVVVVHAFIKPLYGRFDFDIAEANILALQKHLPIEQTGNSLEIGYPQDPAVLRAVSVRYEIQVPRSTQVRAHTESGGIRIDGISGPVEAATGSGRTEISNIAGSVAAASRSGAEAIRDVGGDLTVRSQSGGIQLSNIHGDVQSETASGRTEISGVDGGVRASTHSGSVRIDGVKGRVEARNSSGSIDALRSSGPVQAETASGAIRISQLSPAPIRALSGSGAIKVELASGAGYRLDAQAGSAKVSGRATSTFPTVRNAHSLQGQVGSGGPLVDLDTRSSNIQID